MSDAKVSPWGLGRFGCSKRKRVKTEFIQILIHEIQQLYNVFSRTKVHYSMTELFLFGWSKMQ